MGGSHGSVTLDILFRMLGLLRGIDCGPRRLRRDLGRGIGCHGKGRERCKKHCRKDEVLHLHLQSI
jgi:hypothetical protein